MGFYQLQAIRGPKISKMARTQDELGEHLPQVLTDMVVGYLLVDANTPYHPDYPSNIPNWQVNTVVYNGLHEQILEQHPEHILEGAQLTQNRELAALAGKLGAGDQEIFNLYLANMRMADYHLIFQPQREYYITEAEVHLQQFMRNFNMCMREACCGGHINLVQMMMKNQHTPDWDVAPSLLSPPSSNQNQSLQAILFGPEMQPSTLRGRGRYHKNFHGPK